MVPVNLNNKRVLVLFEGDIYQRRGFFNAAVNRSLFLQKHSGFEMDVLLLSEWEPWFVRLLKRTPKRERPSSVTLDGLPLRIDWRRFSVLDSIFHTHLHHRALVKPRHIAALAPSLGGYDLVIAHSKDCGLLAERVKELFGTPYTITWHGSDIHTKPFKIPSVFKETARLLESADINFFVSQALLRQSDEISPKGVKQVLYNGHDPAFRRYPDSERAALRKKWGVEGKKVVVFAGNFFAVKNPLSLPRIFSAVYEKFKNVEFWFIGDGKLLPKVKLQCGNLPSRFWGGREPEEMPDFFNAADLVVLPSLDEGLPLVLIEALSSGCNAVGSLTGGIPEVIGEENCISLDADFIRNFADKVLFYLSCETRIEQPLKREFNWDYAAVREMNFIQPLLYGGKETGQPLL